MTSPSKAEVLAAIETLNSSYTYERHRWIGAYGTLREVEREFGAQLKPFGWITNVFAFAALASFIVLLLWGATRIGAAPILSNALFESAAIIGLLFIPALLLELGAWTRDRLAARRHPMLLLKTEIQAGLHKYRKLAGDPSPEPYA